MRKYIGFLYGLLFLFTISCNESEETAKPEESTVEDITISEVGQVPSSFLRQIATENGYGSFSDKIKYNVTIARIRYKTNYKGNKVDVSGLIFFPASGAEQIPLLCFNHGTLFQKSDAPSLHPLTTGLDLIAATGYVVVEPDYLGYGASSSIFHPYYDEGYSASVVYDIILAGRKAAQKRNLLSNNKVFLLGYSEGGYVTMAAQKAIESNPDKEWKLAGVAAGAGGYDLQEILGQLSVDDYFDVPAYLAFLIRAYNTTYDWGNPMDFFFASKYAQEINLYMDGSQGGAFVNSKLTERLDSLFNPSFYVGIKNYSDSEFKTAIMGNTLTDWKVTVPTRMYHGTNDSTVYYSNSVATYEKLKANGSKNLEFISIPEGTHSSSLQPVILDVIPWFEGLNKQ